MDNIVYRHEIGMDPLGRLRPGSPVVSAHAIMASCVAGNIAAIALFSWGGGLRFTFALLILFALVTYPLAYARAYRSLWRERVSGSLEQLYLTSLTTDELFEGMFYGALAPFLEARRYLMVLGILFVVEVGAVAPMPVFLAGAALWLMGINHYGYSAVLGTLAGLKAGCLGPAEKYSPLLDMSLNPLPSQIWNFLKYSLVVAPVLFILIRISGPFDWTLISAYALLIMIPYAMSIRLNDRERAERMKLSHHFRKLFSFE